MGDWFKRAILTQVHEIGRNEVEASNVPAWNGRDELPVSPEGFKTFQNIRTRIVLEDTVAKPAPGDRGQTQAYEMRSIKSIAELRERMSVEASASFAGLFGISASAQAAWFKSLAVNNYSTFMLVQVTVDNPVFEAVRPTLRRDVVKALRNDLREFYETYGDAYVFGFRSGGRFRALYEFKTRTVEQKEDVSAKIELAVGNFKSAVELKRSLESITTDVTCHVTFSIFGGRSDVPKPAPDKILEFAETFPGLVDPVKGAPKATGYDLRDFNQAERFPKGLRLPFRENRERLRKLADLNDGLDLMRRDLEYAALHPDFFTLPDVSELAKQASDLQETITKAAGDIVANPTVIHVLADNVNNAVSTVVALTPRFSPISFTPAVGIQEGAPFNDADDGIARRGRRLRQIVVRYGAIIDSLQAFYAVTGRPDHSPGRHGNDRGANQLVVVLDDDEYLTSVHFVYGGTPDNYARGLHILEFATNKGRRLGPVGTEQQRPERGETTFASPEGSAIFAFHGSAGQWIHALGCVMTRVR